MAELTVIVRESDMTTLGSLAEHEWRNNEQQASALIEQALSAYRNKMNPNAVPRRARSRNGVAHVLAGAA